MFPACVNLYMDFFKEKNRPVLQVYKESFLLKKESFFLLKGIILFLTRNHSFFDSFCHFWHSFWSKLSFLFHTTSQETFLCFCVKKECFPWMWGMLSFVKKNRGMLSSNRGMFPEVYRFRYFLEKGSLRKKYRYYGALPNDTRISGVTECRGRV